MRQPLILMALDLPQHARRARIVMCVVYCVCAAMGTTQDCRRQIHRELRYQSSMDLDAGTYAAIRCECRALSAATPCALRLTQHVLQWVALGPFSQRHCFPHFQ